MEIGATTGWKSVLTPRGAILEAPHGWGRIEVREEARPVGPQALANLIRDFGRGAGRRASHVTIEGAPAESVVLRRAGMEHTVGVVPGADSCFLVEAVAPIGAGCAIVTEAALHLLLTTRLWRGDRRPQPVARVAPARLAAAQIWVDA